MATGKVLQFDPGRGYGFVAADDGGEDVFLHASVFDGDPSELVPGTSLEFQVMAGDRGRKAFAVRFAEGMSAAPEQLILPPRRFPPAEVTHSADVEVNHSADVEVTHSAEEDQMCDVLSQAEFLGELTELLVRTIPALTGAQILEVRQGLLEFAKTQGWVDT
jgi:CspA family cold shock protein